MTEVIRMNEPMEKIFNALHRGVWDIEPHRPFLYFTDCGKQRLLSIYGWLTGLHNAGQTEFANVAAANLEEKFNFLGRAEWQDFETKEGWSGTIPARRVLILDDRCFNSFNFIVGKPTEYKETDEKIIENLTYEMYSKNTEKFYKQKIGYRFVYNGGLIYHGPGAGSTFSVSLTGEKFWGIHT